MAGRALKRCGPDATRSETQDGTGTSSSEPLILKVSIVGRGRKSPAFFRFTCFRSSACCRTPAPVLPYSRPDQRGHRCNKNKSDIMFYIRTAITSCSGGRSYEKNDMFLPSSGSDCYTHHCRMCTAAGITIIHPDGRPGCRHNQGCQQHTGYYTRRCQG